MDTQGAFDCNSTVNDSATVFSLSTLLSSMQVYNIESQDDLLHLQWFLEYGRVALDHDCSDKPFQSLQFMGSAQIREHIQSCFDEISCFPLPCPGKRAKSAESFTGKLCDIDMEFKEQLPKLVQDWLAPENLVIKQIHGNKISAKELVEYFKAYILLFQGNDLPEPESAFEANVTAHHLVAISRSGDQYYKEMESIVGVGNPYISDEEIEFHHKRCLNLAITTFLDTPKFGQHEYSQDYLHIMTKDIEKFHQSSIILGARAGP